MIEVGLEFATRDFDQIVTAFEALPKELRPLYFSNDETEVASKTNLIEDSKRFSAFVEAQKYGFFLRSHNISYNIRTVPQKAVICDGFLDVEYGLATEFLAQMTAAKPVFGFACVPEEREWRNRVIVRLGNNTIESWVGRDTRKYVPGLYWTTLMSHALAMRHGISIPDLKRNAIECKCIGDFHLFRFYENPNDWLANKGKMDELCLLSAGIFSVINVRSLLSHAVNLAQHNTTVSQWS